MVDEEMNYWKRRAEQIPNDELRTQALASIKDKRFHCQGGSVYALLAGEREKKAVRFIVAYQTISDYLDNLCDRSTSLDPKDFRMLHEAMKDALTPMNPMKNYYELRDDQADGGYLAELVQTCQETLRDVASFEQIQNQLLKLQGLYADLQVHKHVQLRERIPRLTSWFEKIKIRMKISHGMNFLLRVVQPWEFFVLYLTDLAENSNQIQRKLFMMAIFLTCRGCISCLITILINKRIVTKEILTFVVIMRIGIK